MTELYYCYCIPISLWVLGNFGEGTRKVETKEYWDSFIGKDTDRYKLVKVDDEDQ